MVPFKRNSDHQIVNRFENSSETIREVICKQNRQKQLSRNGKEAIKSLVSFKIYKVKNTHKQTLNADQSYKKYLS